MTLSTPKPSGRSRPFLGLTAILAVIAAVLIGAGQFAQDTARATQGGEENGSDTTQTVSLHQSNVAHGDAEDGTCPPAPAGFPFGWHFVLPGNDAEFVSLDLQFAGGTASAPVLDGKHAYVYTSTATTLISGTATVEGEVKKDFFNLSHTCGSAVEDTGSITIVKQGLLEGATANFTSTIPGGASFTAALGDNTEPFADVAVGSYTVTEAELAGYTLTGASCTGGSGGDGVLSGRTLTIDLDAGEHLTCTFVNAAAQTAQFDVTIAKYIDGALATGGDFSLTATWQAANLNGGAQASGNFNLNSGNGWQHVSALMDAGADLSVVENGIDGDCDDPGDAYRLLGYGTGATLAAAAGAGPGSAGAVADITSDMYIVVFNEACAATGQFDVTIAKYIDGALAIEGDFSLTATWQAANLNGGAQASGNFNLNSGNGWQHVSALMDAGADLSVVENGIDGDCDDPGDVYRLAGYGSGNSLAAAAGTTPGSTGAVTDITSDMYIVVFNVSCAAATQFDVTVTKYIDGQLATEGDFSLTATWTAANLNGGAQTSGNFNLNAGNQFDAVTDLMDAGSDYSVVENGIDADCTDEGDVYRLAGYGTGTTLALAAGATPSMTAALTDIQSDMYIVVFNVSCTAASQFDVTTVKYLDGAIADEGSFDILFTWDADNFNNGNPDSTTIPLATGNGWQHTSALMDAGASFSVEETNVDADCTDDGDSYRLLGYGVGATLDEADNGVDSTTIGELTNLQSDMYIVVFNASCGAVEGTGSIRVEKEWVGGNPVTASFTTTGLEGATFDLVDADDFELFDGLTDGNFVITETIPTGWTVSSIVCTGHTNTVWDTDFPTGVLSVNLVDDEDLVCTFTNTLTATGSLTIDKEWVGGTAPESSSFTTSANLGATGNSFTLPFDADPEMFDNLASGGTYVVTETAISGWTLTGIDCTGDTQSTVSASLTNRELSVVLNGGEDVVCTFTNTMDVADTGSLTIVKNWVGGTAVNTGFTTSDSLNDPDDAFTVGAGNSSMVFPNLANGTVFTVTEPAVTGWTLTDITCTGGGTSTIDDTTVPNAVSVTLAGNADVVCTFTNTADTTTPIFNPGVVSPTFPEQPGVVSPSMPETPSVEVPPSVISPAPVTNIPTAPQLPSAVSSESPVTNVQGEQAPLPPSTGDSLIAGGNANTAIALFAGLAVTAGLATTWLYGLRRR